MVEIFCSHARVSIIFLAKVFNTKFLIYGICNKYVIREVHVQ